MAYDVQLELRSVDFDRALGKVVNQIPRDFDRAFRDAETKYTAFRRRVSDKRVSIKLDSTGFNRQMRDFSTRYNDRIRRLAGRTISVRVDAMGFSRSTRILEERHRNFVKRLRSAQVRVTVDVPAFSRSIRQVEERYRNFLRRVTDRKVRINVDTMRFGAGLRRVEDRHRSFVQKLGNRQVRVEANVPGFTRSLRTAEDRYKTFVSRIRQVPLPGISVPGGVGGGRSGGSGRVGPGGATGALGAFGAGGVLTGRFLSRGGPLSGATGDLVALLTPLAAGITGIGIGLTALGVNAVRAFGQFERSMDHVLAISRATNAEFEDLTNTASQLGITTIFTGEQVAAGMGFLAQAGLDAQQILGGIEPSLHLAQAGVLDLARSADILSNVMTAFRIPAEDAADVADALAFGAANSNTNVEQLGAAMARAGVLAEALNVPLRTTTALIGVFGDAGIQGFIAGRALRLVLQRLSSPLKQAENDFRRLGIQFRDSNGQARQITDILFDVVNSISALPDALDRARTAQRIFGTEAVLYYRTLASRGVDGLRQAILEMGDATDFAAEAARVQTDNLLSDFTRLTSAVNGLNRTIGGLGAGFARDSVQGLTSFVRFLDDAIQRFDAFAMRLDALQDRLSVFGQRVGDAGPFGEFGNFGVVDFSPDVSAFEMELEALLGRRARAFADAIADFFFLPEIGELFALPEERARTPLEQAQAFSQRGQVGGDRTAIRGGDLQRQQTEARQAEEAAALETERRLLSRLRSEEELNRTLMERQELGIPSFATAQDELDFFGDDIADPLEHATLEAQAFGEALSDLENIDVTIDPIEVPFDPVLIDPDQAIIADARELFRSRELSPQEAIALARQRAQAAASAELVGGDVDAAIAAVDDLGRTGQFVDGVFKEVGTTVSTVVDAFVDWENRTVSLTDVIKNLGVAVANLVAQIYLLEPLEEFIRGVANTRSNRDGGGGGGVNLGGLFTAFAGGVDFSGGGPVGGRGVGIQGTGGGAVGGIFRPRGGIGSGVRGAATSGLRPAGFGGDPFTSTGGLTIQTISHSLEPQAAGRFAENAVVRAADGLGQVTTNRNLDVY